jgi:hypothetical protein
MRNPSGTAQSWHCDSGGIARSFRDNWTDFLLVTQGYVVEYEFIRLLSHTARVEEAVGKGVTRCTSPRCVCYLIMIDPGF